MNGVSLTDVLDDYKALRDELAQRLFVEAYSRDIGAAVRTAPAENPMVHVHGHWSGAAYVAIVAASAFCQVMAAVDAETQETPQ